MKKAEIYSVTTPAAPGYAWKWRATGGKTKTISKAQFKFYYECLENALRAGYEVELTHAQGMTAPGGSQSEMR